MSNTRLAKFGYVILGAVFWVLAIDLWLHGRISDVAIFIAGVLVAALSLGATAMILFVSIDEPPH